MRGGGGVEAGCGVGAGAGEVSDFGDGIEVNGPLVSRLILAGTFRHVGNAICFC